MKIPYQAISHLRILLNQGYTLEQALHFVGNRFQLTSTQRQLLKRGVCSFSEIRTRQKKKRGLWRLHHAQIGIDGHNVLITLESALKGKLLLLADDGFIRDIAAISANYRPSQTTKIALQLIFEILNLYQPVWVEWYFDAPLSFSGELAADVRKMLQQYCLSGNAQAVPVPEYHLKNYELIATSDRALIDKCSEVIDLAGEILKFSGLSFPLYNFKEIPI